MAITAGMVKELREMTGAGMMDCKKALSETNGDMEMCIRDSSMRRRRGRYDLSDPAKSGRSYRRYPSGWRRRNERDVYKRQPLPRKDLHQVPGRGADRIPSRRFPVRCV